MVEICRSFRKSEPQCNAKARRTQRSGRKTNKTFTPAIAGGTAIRRTGVIDSHPVSSDPRRRIFFPAFLCVLCAFALGGVKSSHELRLQRFFGRAVLPG